MGSAMRTEPTPAEIVQITKRVQALDPEARNDLLFSLLGRLLVSNPKATVEELEKAEREAVGI